MTNREFEQLVARLEAQALRRPWLYKHTNKCYW